MLIQWIRVHSASAMVRKYISTNKLSNGSLAIILISYSGERLKLDNYDRLVIVELPCMIPRKVA